MPAVSPPPLVRSMARIRILLPAVVFVLLCFGLLGGLAGDSDNAPIVPLASPPADLFTPEQLLALKRTPKYAITSSVQTASFTAMALMLGYSIMKHNDLSALDAEMVLLVRPQGPDAKDGVTPQNVTRLEQAGWKVRLIQDLEFEGVNIKDIRAHHRHNLNKLNLWKWTEYEKIVFIDADVVCKGSVQELLDMPADFAASPDVWWYKLTDTLFNSGVIVFRPSMETFHDMIPKVSDPNYHSPNDADQAFLNAYYKFRFFALPYKYNFNLVMYQYHREVWDKLWPEAVFVHFTMRKPRRTDHCHKGCNEWEPLEWYGQFFKEMLAFYGWEKDMEVYQ